VRVHGDLLELRGRTAPSSVERHLREATLSSGCSYASAFPGDGDHVGSNLAPVPLPTGVDDDDDGRRRGDDVRCRLKLQVASYPGPPCGTTKPDPAAKSRMAVPRGRSSTERELVRATSSDQFFQARGQFCVPSVQVRGPLKFRSRRIVFGCIFARRAGTFRVAWLRDGMIYVYVSERSETLWHSAHPSDGLAKTATPS
jgi:hypothetical protein